MLWNMIGIVLETLTKFKQLYENHYFKTDCWCHLLTVKSVIVILGCPKITGTPQYILNGLRYQHHTHTATNYNFYGLWGVSMFLPILKRRQRAETEMFLNINPYLMTHIFGKVIPLSFYNITGQNGGLSKFNRFITLTRRIFGQIWCAYL